jgi:hypothetical protein
MKRTRNIGLLLATAWSLAAVGRAEIVVLDATDAGFVTVMGGSAKGDATLAPSAKYNYSVGRELHYATGALGPTFAAMDRKNYFVFDLTDRSTIKWAHWPTPTRSTPSA